MRIGIIGAGQLGQMLGLAGRDLNIDCHFVDPARSPPAAVAGPVIQAEFDDRQALATLAARCDVVSYEFENVPIHALLNVAQTVPVYPPPEALRHAQDRLREKRLFQSLDLPIADYRTVDSMADLRDAAATLGLPLMLKKRRLGYDGKGQFVVKQSGDIDVAWAKLGGADLIAEQWVEFDFEVSAIGARNVDGNIVTYPLTHNEHQDGILCLSRAPVENPTMSNQADDFMCRILEHLNYVGVLALELFVRGASLLANEFAPRVHNSGHWTIEGATTSQFRNHLLAVSNRPLGSTAVRGYAGMLNLIGEIPPITPALARGQLHNYGKAARPGRKLGHITVVAESAAQRDLWLTDMRKSVTKSNGQTGTPT